MGCSFSKQAAIAQQKQPKSEQEKAEELRKEVSIIEETLQKKAADGDKTAQELLTGTTGTA